MVRVVPGLLVAFFLGVVAHGGELASVATDASKECILRELEPLVQDESGTSFAADFPKLTGDLYKTFDMKEGYQGEELRNPNIKYGFTEQELEDRRLIVKDGKLYTPNGQQLLPGKKYIYVMDASGNIYVDLDMYRGYQGRQHIKHSSFFSGNPVAAAGTMKIINNKLVFATLDNESGHYKPPHEAIEQALMEFEKEESTYLVFAGRPA